MSYVHVSTDSGLAEVRLERGNVNALNEVVIDELAGCFQRLAAEPTAICSAILSLWWQRSTATRLPAVACSRSHMTRGSWLPAPADIGEFTAINATVRFCAGNDPAGYAAVRTDPSAFDPEGWAQVLPAASGLYRIAGY